MAKTLCFDLDGTLCTNTFGAYESAEPFPWAIARVRALARAGHRVVIATARGSATGIDWSERTRAQLERWGVEYDALVFGKPSADVYIDDRAVHADAWRAGGTFAAPGFEALAHHVSRIVESGRTYGGRPLGLMEHVARARAAASAAGLRLLTDPTAVAGRIRAGLEDCAHNAASDIVYVLTLAAWPTAAHLDAIAADAATVAVDCRGLDEVARGLAPLLAPGDEPVQVLAQISAAPDPSRAWPLRRAMDGSIVDGLGCQLGVVRRDVLRLEPPLGPPSVASIWVRALAAAHGVNVELAPIRDADIDEADEVLIAGLPFCLLPVAAIGSRRVGDGESRITRELLAAWSAEVELDLAAQTAALAQPAEASGAPVS
jgi:branched-subunit amino acid aminotransferase/4-amino-4-deoxychorismate lyase